MPLMEVEIVGDLGTAARDGLAQRIADAAGVMLGIGSAGDLGPPARSSRPSTTRRTRSTPGHRAGLRECPAKRRNPEDEALEREVTVLTTAIAAACGRPMENVHVRYEAPAAGRQAFGGRLDLGPPGARLDPNQRILPFIVMRRSAGNRWIRFESARDDRRGRLVSRVSPLSRRSSSSSSSGGSTRPDFSPTKPRPAFDAALPVRQAGDGSPALVRAVRPRGRDRAAGNFDGLRRRRPTRHSSTTPAKRSGRHPSRRGVQRGDRSDPRPHPARRHLPGELHLPAARPARPPIRGRSSCAWSAADPPPFAAFIRDRGLGRRRAPRPSCSSTCDGGIASSRAR